MELHNIRLNHVIQCGARRKYVTVTVSWATRFLTLVVQMLLMPVLLHLLGDQKFSVYQVIISLQGWLVLCTFGVGPALKNMISEVWVKGESDRNARYAVAFFLWIVSLGFTALFFALAPFLSSLILGKLTQGEHWADFPFVLGGLLMLVIGIGQVGAEVLYAEMRAHWVYLLPAAGQTLGLGFIYCLSRAGVKGEAGLLWVIVFWLCPQAIGASVILWMAGLIKVPRLWPESTVVRRLARPALRFFVFALLSNAVLLVDYLVMSQILQPSEIVVYSAMMRAVSLFLVFYMALLLIIWPEWSVQMQKGLWAQTSRRVLRLAGGGILVCMLTNGLMLWAAPPLLRFWLRRPDLVFSPVTILLFFGYMGIRVWTDTHAVALQSANRMRTLIITVIVQALITMPAEVFLGSRWGANGIVLGLIVGFLLTAAWSLPYKFHAFARQMASP